VIILLPEVIVAGNDLVKLGLSEHRKLTAVSATAFVQFCNCCGREQVLVVQFITEVLQPKCSNSPVPGGRNLSLTAKRHSKDANMLNINIKYVKNSIFNVCNELAKINIL
jgi:hypothetical protein